MAATILDGHQIHLHNGNDSVGASVSDPFVDADSLRRAPRPHRYSSFNMDNLSLDSVSSPSQLKRTLQAHLSETDRRLQETQKLGTALLQQQHELSEKLKEVEAQDSEAKISPELQQRLVELEKEHNDVGREVAKALLAPRARNVSGEDKPGSEASGPITAQVTASPSKASVPGRKDRNQSVNRAGDIQFAADISTSLLVLVRQLQASLSERDEALKTVNLEKARLEHESEGFHMRLRALDENEQRYKDENWELETQTHELIAAAKEAADREKKLNISLATALAEKTKAQSDLDEITLAHGKLTEEYAMAQKSHDSELHSLRRTVDASDTERSGLQGKIEELTSQNQELVRAMTARFRGGEGDDERGQVVAAEDFTRDLSTPEHSPPPSPTKATPRHGGLESETLKSSLHHAHRMIQNLKGNIHREKTEKMELKRMLQDARDELEQRRSDSNGLGSGSKRQKTRSEIFKKPVRPDMLGGSRKARTDVELEDQDWEDHAGGNSPSEAAASRNVNVIKEANRSHHGDMSDAYQTANETEGAFETANEKDTTESEDFMTGAESFAGDSNDELTETEGRFDRVNTIRAARASRALKIAGNRSSYLSTASTSAGEGEEDLQTPIQPQAPKYRLKLGRGAGARQTRSEYEGTPESYYSQVTARDSPSSYRDSQSPAAGEQSLFAELGDFNEASSDAQFSTPGRASIFSNKSTPVVAPPSGHRSLMEAKGSSAATPEMVDSGTMTEPWQPEIPSVQVVSEAGVIGAVGAAAATGPVPGFSLHEYDISPPSPSDFPLPPSLHDSPIKNEFSSQHTPYKPRLENSPNNLPAFITPPKTQWDEAHDQGHDVDLSDEMGQQYHGPLTLSNFVYEHTTPVAAEVPDSPPVAELPKLTYSSLHTQQIQPVVREKDSLSEPGLGAGKDSEISHTEAMASDKTSVVAAGVGILASVGAALGFAKTRDSSNLQIAEDETSHSTSEIAPTTESKKLPLQDVSGNSVPQRDPIKQKEVSNTDGIKLKSFIGSDQGSQTILSSEQIDRALQGRNPRQDVPPKTPESAAPSGLQNAGVIGPFAASSRSGSRSREKAVASEASGMRDNVPLGDSSPFKRPTSANGQRVAIPAGSHPPLPMDHKTAIARAGGRLTSPVAEPSNSSHVASIMGPPIAPASAYRRPRTPGDQTISVGSPSRGGTTPRATNPNRQIASSQYSRRSSVSSFASELDKQFNIRSDGSGLPHAQGFEPGAGTDPRMIQAITQTMIGEFLWKYTRKPGRPEMSNTRHRRYFWVHPYTRTLYWSDQDPQSAGRSELKAKSVAIESVRVVTDDNPMPPGLHRKSLEVITPGRKVKFTASTGQRHETWFNALSYLLLRGEDAQEARLYSSRGPPVVVDEGLTAEDVNEFNPGHGRILQPSNSSRISLSSYNSRTTHGTGAQGTASRTVVRQSTASNIIPTLSIDGTAASRHLAQQRSGDQQSRPQDGDRIIRKNSSVSSRFSRMLGSVTAKSRTDRPSEPGFAVVNDAETGNNGSIYNASIVSDGGNDSAEDLRREILKQEKEADRLENVRACCDGKHDVSTLSARGHHHHSHTGPRMSQNLERLSQSISKRPVGTLKGYAPTAETSNI